MRLFRVLAILALLAVGVPAAVHSATGPSRAGHARNTPPLFPPLKRQPTPEAVVAEHLAALNACDWNRLMAQYPPSVRFFLPGGVVIVGRKAVGELFTGFCKSRAEGGNFGLIFTPEQTFKVGKTINTQWRAEADFLTEPYRGADAYVTKGGLMYAQVTTFGAPPLPYK
jgi:SnoaL-like domain